tara:strand:+ start:613 stop:1023 length:411 start_codon:yes stop_codon:yes gene_type:complete
MQKLKKAILESEGYRPTVYKCTEGFDTIGIGFKIDDLYLSKEVCDIILEEKLLRFMKEIMQRAEWVNDMPLNVKDVILEMCYQMGVPNFLMFKKTIALFKQHDWVGASKEMLDSKWARQTPNRAKKLSLIIADEAR